MDLTHFTLFPIINTLGFLCGRMLPDFCIVPVALIFILVLLDNNTQQHHSSCSYTPSHLLLSDEGLQLLIGELFAH